MPIGITKDGRWLAGTPAQKMLPDVLRAGQRVMLAADPNVAALVPLDDRALAPARSAWTWFSPSCTARTAKTARCRACSIWPGCRYVGSGVIGSAVGMDKDMQKRLFLQAKLPVGDFLAILRCEWEKSAQAS